MSKSGRKFIRYNQTSIAMNQRDEAGVCILGKHETENMLVVLAFTFTITPSR